MAVIVTLKAVQLMFCARHSILCLEASKQMESITVRQFAFYLMSLQAVVSELLIHGMLDVGATVDRTDNSGHFVECMLNLACADHFDCSWWWWCWSCQWT
jgi:hypothetical protein